MHATAQRRKPAVKTTTAKAKAKALAPELSLFTQKPTLEQQACVEAFLTGRGLRVNAYAGMGKTSTLVQMANATKKRGSYLAYNKSMAAEARGRFPVHVKCSTVHGLAYGARIRRLGEAKITGRLNSIGLCQEFRLNDMRFGDVDLTRRSFGALAVETVERWCCSGRAEITARDVPRDGVVGTLEGNALEAVQHAAVSLARAAWLRMSDPASALPLTFDGSLKLWALGRPTIPGDFILLDEGQDVWISPMWCWSGWRWPRRQRLGPHTLQHWSPDWPAAIEAECNERTIDEEGPEGRCAGARGGSDQPARMGIPPERR